MYQSSNRWPTVDASAAPSARKVPNGSAYFMSPLRNATSVRPTIEPAIDAIINVTSVSFQPTNAPIIASIFTSPMPSPERQGASDERFHVTGQQLCLGLRELAIQRYGLLAKTVLHKWGVRKTDDFGTIVYAMIDRAELRSSDRDSIEDFAGVYDFDEAFEQACPR